MDLRKDFFLVDELCSDEMKGQFPDGKRCKISKQELISSVIQTGCLDEIWESDAEDDGRRYGRTKKINYFIESTWGRWLCDPRINDHKTKEGKRFRSKFRLPYPVFANLVVPECDRLNVFEVIDPARVRVPTEIKVLICLRIIGRGAYHDDIAEMSLCFKSTINHVFRKFLNNFVPRFYDIFVTPPTGETLKKVMETYSKLGFPGAMGSMDVTHIPWGRCPAKWTNLASGKDPSPTCAFNCVVDPSYYIHSVSPIILGGTNDITASRVDPYSQAFTLGKFKNIKFHVFVEENSIKAIKGGYLITDGGYPKLNCFICPLSHRCDRASSLFSEYMESARKDVECTFGQLKSRWRLLKKPLEMDSVLEIENLFKLCCILHNMILIYDGRDITQWELGVDWELMDPDVEDYEDDEDVDNIQTMIPVDTDDDFELPHVQLATRKVTSFHPTDDHFEFITMLSQSFEIQFDMGLIQWPRSFNTHQKSIMPINRIKRIAARANKDMYASLLVKDSVLLAMDGNGNYTKKIGLGLFAGMNYKSGQEICSFKQGERISSIEYNTIRVRRGEGGYALQINNAEYMDNYSIREQCKASMANDARNAWNTATKSKAKNNAEISRHVTATTATFKIKALTKIKIGEEIIVNYETDYIMPEI